MLDLYISDCYYYQLLAVLYIKLVNVLLQKL